MTRDEFIDGYLARSDFTQYRTPDGYAIDGHGGAVALPCECGEEGCDGWAMISNNPWSIRSHLFFYGPDEGRPSSPMGDDERRALKNAIDAYEAQPK